MANKMLFGYFFGKLSIAVIPQDQPKAEKGDWYEIDTSKLPKDVAQAYEDSKDAYKMYKEAKTAFEGKMKAHLKFEDKPKLSVVRPQRQSLTEYLAARRA